MSTALNRTLRRFWSSVITAFVTLAWLSLMAFQSYSSGRWLINGLLVTFMLGLWLVDRRLRPTVPPTSPGPVQFSLSKLLRVLTYVAIVIAIFAWFDREHRRVVEKSNQRVEQIMKRSQTIDELVQSVFRRLRTNWSTSAGSPRTTSRRLREAWSMSRDTISLPLRGDQRPCVKRRNSCMSPVPNTRRRWFQFGIRSLLFAVVALAAIPRLDEIQGARAGSRSRCIDE